MKCEPTDLKSATPWLFAMPALVFFLCLIVYPALQSFVVSLTNANLDALVPVSGAETAARDGGMRSLQFIGLANYFNLFENASFLNSVQTLLKFSAVTAVLEIVFAVGVALFFEYYWRPNRIVRTLLLVPMFVIPLVSGLTFRLLLDPNEGVLAEFYRFFELAPVDFLGDPQLAFWAVVFQDFWRMWPFVFLIVSAGLKSLPVEPLEAFSLDGGTQLQSLIYIVLPMLAPTLVVALGLKLIESLKAFTEIYAMTGGGPGESTQVLSMFVVREAFDSFKLSSAAAAGSILLFAGSLFALSLVVYSTVRSAQKERAAE